MMLKGEAPLYKKNTESSKKQTIDHLLPQFLSLFLRIKKEVGFYLLIDTTLKYWTPRLILQQIEQGLESLQKEREIQLLGEFNHKISSLVQAEDAPYIYARLGERYKHYYIDEFQDTSSLQWSNLIPLIGNALESESLSGERFIDGEEVISCNLLNC
jgi:ATP-dependent exoDNAse (exonuclease V) beta subunit